MSCVPGIASESDDDEELDNKVVPESDIANGKVFDTVVFELRGELFPDDRLLRDITLEHGEVWDGKIRSSSIILRCGLE